MANYEELIGTPIEKIREKLGYWWICTNSHIVSNTGIYTFNRSAGGFLEVRTEHNMIISEHHNDMAELMLRRDNKTNSGN